MQQVTVFDLKKFEQLANVPDSELEWLIANSQLRVLQDGDHLATQGQPLAGPHFLIAGRLHIYIDLNNSRREIAIVGAGAITGYLPYSRGLVATVNSRAIGELTVLSYPTDKLMEMITGHFEITQALVHTMSNRVREFTTMQQQNEKMVALGKLSAGLTHELNNPASAIVRDSVALKQHLQLQTQKFKSVIAIRMDAAQIDAVSDEFFRLLAIPDKPALTLKEKTKLEDEVSDWLEEHNVENNYDIAENFVDYNFGIGAAEALTKNIPEAYYSPVLNWISNLLMTERIVENIQESSRRIAELVTSVKNFTHMDRGTDKQYANIHTGIRNTLTMLGYKLRKNNITLVEDYDETLPKVKALIGELNQVWTNLIDNAIDAMEAGGKGTLTIKTERDREFVQVFIIDDGPGIPEDIRPRIFDPFFTTKEIGKGTGIGLEVVQRIVQQHNGSIKVSSVPGRTEFVVCFPFDS